MSLHLEADRLVARWARMQEREKQSPPQFMSTHPSVGIENEYGGILANLSQNYNRMEAIQGLYVS
jgi:hypothetical protein